MRGFQLWINLPAKEKMKPAGYRDIQPDEIPVVALAGRRSRQGDRRHARCQDGHETRGPIQGLTTDPLYFDVELARRSDLHASGAGGTQRVPLSVRGERRGRTGAPMRAGSGRTTPACWPTATKSR